MSTGIIERTLADISHSLEQALFAEEIARRDGLLQSLDPRVKIIAFLGLLIAVSLSKSLVVILGLYAVVLVLAAASHVPQGFFVKRVWLFMPFFTGIIVVPALFITPGPPLFLLPGPVPLVITRPGVISGAFLILRVGTSVSIAVLLVLTTPWNHVLRALSVLRVPQVFVLILGMTHRYIYLLLHTANDMFLARKSRVVGRMSGADHRRWIAASVGVLLGKSFHLSNEVYLAMTARGFTGRARIAQRLTLTQRDWLWGGGLLGVALLAMFLGR
jgi:cobalt/nickel transport system permease protein